MTLPYALEMEAVLTACKEAGEMALAHAGRPPQVAYKGGLRSSPVTEVDQAIDDYLKHFFAEKFPEDGWLSEENGASEEYLSAKRYWLVDPIDGTTSYLKWLESGMPHEADRQARRQFSISIALIEDGQPVVAAVYAPLKKQLIHAVVGQGVHLNGQPVQRLPAPPALELATYLSSVSEFKEGLLQFLIPHLPMQPYGSVAYKLALTAVRGEAVTGSVKPKSAWDVAAGDLLCREAGVKVTDLEGNPLRYDQEDVSYNGLVVAPPELYDALKDLMPPETTGGYR